jgi:hypothetical protein
MTAPTARELLDEINAGLVMHPGRQATAELAARVEKVLALHSPTLAGLPPSAIPRCADCKQEWPCSTVRILNGEEP